MPLVKNNNNSLNVAGSYSDLFEDFFKTDAQSDLNTAAASASGSTRYFNGSTGDFLSDYTPVNYNDLVFSASSTQQQLPIQNQSSASGHFAQIPQTHIDAYYQLITQRQQQEAAQMQQLSMLNQASMMTSVAKPNFVRNKQRRTTVRHKSLSHHPVSPKALAPAEPTASSKNNYQQAAQIKNYQPTSPRHHNSPHGSPMVLSPKSPSRHINSPNNTSSDYVKQRLQQQIRSRMVSKGQIPPNPTEEELRLCAMQVPSTTQAQNQNNLHPLNAPILSHQQQQQQQQLPAPMSSNVASYICSNSNEMPSTNFYIPSPEDDLMNYFGMTSSQAPQVSQKDPLVLEAPDRDTKFAANNYDQFFSDFILY